MEDEKGEITPPEEKEDTQGDANHPSEKLPGDNVEGEPVQTEETEEGEEKEVEEVDDVKEETGGAMNEEGEEGEVRGEEPENKPEEDEKEKCEEKNDDLEESQEEEKQGDGESVDVEEAEGEENKKLDEEEKDEKEGDKGLEEEIVDEKQEETEEEEEGEEGKNEEKGEESEGEEQSDAEKEDDDDEEDELSDFSDDEKGDREDDFEHLMSPEREKCRMLLEEQLEQAAASVKSANLNGGILKRDSKRDSLMGDLEIEAAILGQKEQDEKERKMMEASLQKSFDASSFGDIVKEGWVTFKEEGLLKKKKKRFFRLYGKQNKIKYSKEENLNVEGDLDVHNLLLKVFPGKKPYFIMQPVRKFGEKLKKMTFWCPNNEDMEDWVCKIQDFCKFSCRYKYDEKQTKEIGLKIKDILLQFAKNGCEYAVEQCLILKHEYPRSTDVVLTLAHLQSKLGMKKKGLQQAIQTLQDELIFKFEERMDTLTNEIKASQFKFNFRLGILAIKVFYENGNLQYARQSKEYLERCKLIYEKDEENLENLAGVYDELKLFDQASLIWANLVKLHPRNHKFIVRHIKDLKETHQWERLLYFLLEENKKKTEYPEIYSELSQLVTVKSLKRFYTRKFEFYTWLPSGMTHLKFNEKVYKEYLKYVVKLNLAKTSSVSENENPFAKYFEIVDESTNDFFLAFLLSVDKVPYGKLEKEVKKQADLVFKELGNRIFNDNPDQNDYDEHLFDRVFQLFQYVWKGQFCLVRASKMLFLKSKKLLREKKRYKKLVKIAVEVYKRRRYTRILNVFIELKESLLYKPVLKVALDEKMTPLGYRLHAILSITKFCKGKEDRLKEVVSKYREKLKGVDTDPAAKVAFFLVNYKVNRENVDFSLMVNLKLKKELPLFISDYASKLEKVDEEFNEWVTFHKFRDKNRGCKVM